VSQIRSSGSGGAAATHGLAHRARAFYEGLFTGFCLESGGYVAGFELVLERNERGMLFTRGVMLVFDRFGRTHDIANLFICDGSILPTQGSANPGLTIQALAARTADYLIEQGDTIVTSSRRELKEPKVRFDLSPPFTHFRGNPHLA
jgi:hypothetical protein